MHYAEVLIGHFREMVGNWPLASWYFALWLDTLKNRSFSYWHYCAQKQNTLILVRKHSVPTASWAARGYVQYCAHSSNEEIAIAIVWHTD